MQEEKIAFVQILRVPDSELYQIKDGKTSVKARGALQVLYSHSYDLSILRIGDFKFALVNNLEVIATQSVKDEYRSYMLPCPSGSFIFKILNSEQNAAVDNLDTVLGNTTHLLHRTGLEEQLGNRHEAEVIEQGTSFAGGLHKVTDKVSHIVAPSTNESHGNQRVSRSFDEIKNIESKGSIVVDISKDELRNLTDEAGEIARNHQEAPHWKELRNDPATGFYTTLAGTGLTSQSMGSEETGQPQVIIPDQSEKNPEQSDFDKATAGSADKDLEIPFSNPNDQNKPTTSKFVARNLELKPSESLSSQKSWGSNVTNPATSTFDSESVGGSDIGSDFGRANIGSNKDIVIPLSENSKDNKLENENVGGS